MRLAQTDGTTTSVDYASLATAVTTAIGARTDLAFNAGVLTFTSSGSAMANLVVSLGATDDTLVGGPESYTLAISNPSSTTGADVLLSGSDNSVSTSITDNDSATWSLTGSTSVDEGTSATYTVSLAGVLQSGETAKVQLALTDGTTTSADHAALATAVAAAIGARTDLSFSGGVLTFTGTGAMSNLVINLSTTDDTLVEGSESYTLAISNPSSTTGADVLLNGSDYSVSTSIADLDSATWSITGSTSLAEGASASYTVSLAFT